MNDNEINFIKLITLAMCRERERDFRAINNERQHNY